MNLGVLSLAFDSAVSNNTDDIDWTGVSLRTHMSALDGRGINLWNTEEERGWGNAMSANSELTLELVVHPTDLDELKVSYIGHNSSFAWIELREGTFKSSSRGEPSEPVYGTQVYGHSGMSVRDLVQDTTRSDAVGRCCIVRYSR